MIDVVILGTGDLAEDLTYAIADVNDDSPTFNLIGYLDRPSSATTRDLERLLGSDELLEDLDVSYLIANASPAIRQRLDVYATQLGRTAATLIHPSATVTNCAAIGPGTVIFAGVWIGRRVTFGRHVQVNVATTVGHGCTLGDYVTLNPQAAIAANCHFRTGATVGIGGIAVQGITVGEHSTIGAGSTATRSMPPNTVAVGVPATVLRLGAARTSTTRRPTAPALRPDWR
jgi:sugar O-acyltransferase (sialic acid O-acetyltransferase NeuD family)